MCGYRLGPSHLRAGGIHHEGLNVLRQHTRDAGSQPFLCLLKACHKLNYLCHVHCITVLRRVLRLNVVGRLRRGSGNGVL